MGTLSKTMENKMDTKQKHMITELYKLKNIMLNENSPRGEKICKDAIDYISS